jgi:hypothetical protein
MKKYILLTLVVLTGLISCKKEFLKEQPYSFISADALYKTNEGAEAAINGCWRVCSDFAGYGSTYNVVLSLTSGGYYSAVPGQQDLRTLTFNASSVNFINNSIWDKFYQAINVSNDIIQKIPSGGAADSVKKAIAGEAYLIRGMLYFNLVRLYGGIPLRTIPTVEAEVNLPRAPISAVYDQIISDLKKAEDMMSATNKTGRPTKYAAYALLGKVYIQLAGDNQASPYWQLAKDELLEVYNKGGYSLVKSSAQLFDINNENTKESIIEIQYSGTGGSSNGQHNNIFSPTSTLSPRTFAQIKPNKEIFDRHRAQYATDPRLDANYFYNSFIRSPQNTVQTIWPVNTINQGFPYLKKYVDVNYAGGATSTRNFIYLRYADVLLSLAECENEINGPANAYQYVNMVLERARDRNGNGSVIATTPANWSGMTQAVFRDRIMSERSYELEGELHLWYDVRRRGVDKYVAFLKAHNDFSKLNLSFDVKYPLDPRTMLLPIPASEINQNATISESDQNPGY